MGMYDVLAGTLGLVLFSACAEQDTVGPTPPTLGTTEEALHWGPDPVGLSLFFRNGSASPIALIGESRRYLQELDISEQVVTETDQGIEPLFSAPATASLNWQGVEMVEELYIPGLDGTFTRERYYRNARWMEKNSVFSVSAHDQNGTRVGKKLRFRAGKDDKWGFADDGFVRRFNARQLAFGCAAPGDCSGASYVAEALVQVRSAVRPRWRARRIPQSATELRLHWTAQPEEVRSVAVSHVTPEEAAYGYGFSVELAELSAPPNGEFYEPGESVTFQLTFKDGSGTRLHQPGSLPTYAEYIAGGTASGLRYLDLALPTRLYHALKHRESNLMVGLSGPVDSLRTAQTVVDPLTFFLPQTQFAFADVDGYTAAIQTVPTAAILFGGFQDPNAWLAPVSDQVSFTVPADAQPGSYLAVVKARRDYGGEALQRGATATIQVGQAAVTTFNPSTTCNGCHSVPGAGLDETLHGIGDRATCFGCHSSLAIEFDNALDIRVHRIHSLSDRFPGDVNDCSRCHLDTPTGPARGL